jgi:hypothetical protein
METSLYAVLPAPGEMPGVSRLLKEIVNLDPLWELIYLAGNNSEIISGKTVIFGNLTQGYLDWMNTSNPSKVAFLWASPILQSELTLFPSLNEQEKRLELEPIELHLFQLLLQMLKNRQCDRIFMTDRELADCFPELPALQHLPAPMGKPELKDISQERGDNLNLGFFGVPRARKNFSTPLFAAHRLNQSGTSVCIHTNAFEGKFGIEYKNLIQNLQLPARHHGWLEEGKYRETITEMDLGINCFVSESHSYITADFLGAGVPVLASPTVASNFQFSDFKLENFIVKNIDDPLEISEKIKTLDQSGELHSEETSQKCIALINEVGQQYATAARTLLNGWLDSSGGGET